MIFIFFLVQVLEIISAGYLRTTFVTLSPQVTLNKKRPFERG